MEIKEESLLKIGDKVQVLEYDGSGGKPKQKHFGIVVGLTNSAAQVYRPKNGNDDTGGDVDRASAEWFAIDGRLIKTVLW